MNESHLSYLASPAWAETLRTDLLPWLRGAADLGDDVLEIGPGPGLTTDLLLEVAGRVTAVEVDHDLATSLRERLHGENVEVIHGDARTVGLEEGRFTAGTCFSMLHHMESPQAQDELFVRLHALLRPGAALLGVDSIDSEMIRQGHRDDTYVPVDPDALEDRLRAAGFVDISVNRPNQHQFRFTARKPTPPGLPVTPCPPPAHACAARCRRVPARSEPPSRQRADMDRRRSCGLIFGGPF